MVQILTFIVSFAGRFLTTRILYLFALKTFFFSLFTIVVPTIIIKLITKFIEYSISYASNQVSSSGMHSISLDLIGMGGYLATETGLVSCFSIVLSAVALRATLNLISPRL